jgi:SAM-dependent methyltransferase
VAALLAPHHQYQGVDLSPEMVHAATHNVPSGRFHVADMRDFEHPAGSLDAVVAFYSIIHVPRSDQPALFRRIHSWLRPGGYFIANLTAGDLAEGWEDDWLGAGPMYWSGHDAVTNLQLLGDAGFNVIEAKVIQQMEGDEPVRFQWTRARA